MSGVQTISILQRHILTTDSSSISTGSIIVNGGIGLAKTLYAGSTINSSSVSTGGVIIAGGIGIASNASIGGVTRIYNTTEATTATTGALIVDGGFGVSKDAFFAGDVTIAQTLTAQSLVYEYETVIQSTADSTSVTTGSAVINGGVGIAKNANIGGVLSVYDTTESTSSSTGGAIISGGLGIAKNLFVGGNLDIGGTLGFESANIDSSAEATSTTTGALKVVGGIGLGKGLYMAGVLTNINTTESTSATTGSAILSGGIGISKNLHVGGNTVLVGTLDTGAATLDSVSITDATGASDTATGALKVAGGASIVEDLYIGGNSVITGTLSSAGITSSGVINLTNATGASDTATGALKVAGGVGIVENLHVGGNSVITGTLAASGVVSVLNATASTDTASGALLVSGGVGIVGGIHVGGTSAFSGTVTVSTQSYNDNSTKVASTAYVDTALTTQNTVMVVPTGFENQTDSTVTYDSATRILTIAPAVTSFNVWVAGVRYTKTEAITSTAHADVAGTRVYYYFDAAGALQTAASFPQSYNVAMAAFLYYYSDTIYLLGEERHGTVMDPATHRELHATIGTYYVSGLAAADYTLNPAVPADSHNNFSIATGVISDEQLNSTITALPADGPYTVAQITGASAIWTWTLSSASPFHVETDSYIRYNQNNGGTWQLTTLANDNWVNYYICFTTSVATETEILIIPGQTAHTSLSTAQAESFYNLNTSGLPFPEFLPLYKLTFRTSTLYTNIGKCRIEEFSRIVGDRVSITNNTVANHQALTGLEQAGTGVTYGHITDQAQTISGIKTFGNTTESTSASTGGIIISGGIGITKSANIGGVVKILDTTEATSASTGALILSGGFGVSKDAFFAGDVTIAQTLTAQSLVYEYETVIQSTADSTSVTTGSAIINGGVGIAKNANIGGVLSVYDTTESTSPSTGGAIISGGLGVAKNLYVGGNLDIEGTLGFESAQINSSAETTSVTTGALKVVGGLGLGMGLYMGGVLTNINTTESTSATTGSAILSGGVGIAKNLHVGGNTILVGTIDAGAATLDSVSITDATGASDTATGALKVAGGVGIVENLHVGGNSVITGTLSSAGVTSSGVINLTNATGASDTATGALKVAGGVGIVENLHVGGNSVITGTLSASGALSVLNTTESTDTATGSLIVSGGVGVAKKLNVAGIAAFVQTDNATSASTGGVQISGGVGVAKDIFIGGESLKISNISGSREEKVISLGTPITILQTESATIYSLVVPTTNSVMLSIGVVGYDVETKTYVFMGETSYVFFRDGTDVISATGAGGNLIGRFEAKEPGWGFTDNVFSFVDGGSGAVDIQFNHTGSKVEDFVIGTVTIRKTIGIIPA